MAAAGADHRRSASAGPRAARLAESGRGPALSRRGRLQPAREVVMRRVVLVLTILACASVAHAEVKRIVIDRKVSPAFDGKSFGSAGQYETLAGRAFGELDPDDPHNRVITDIRLAQRNANGKVEYVATFFLVKP